MNSSSIVLCVCIGGSLWAGCGDDSPGVPDSGMESNRLATVQSLGRDVVLPAYRDFAAATATLETAVAAWAASGSDTDRDAARDAWRGAMDLWQQAEAMQIGPAGAVDTTVAGEDLRDEIYSWPIVNRCRVDQELVSAEYVDVDGFAAENVNVRGLDTLEYLLFYEADDNGCAALSTINMDGSWDAIVPELATRRAAYAATAATLVRRAAEGLVGRWDDGFLDALTTAGAGSETYRSAQDALNAISDALFYIDKETKDMKVAEPGGISETCLAAACPELRESLWANRSVEHMANNLRGFQRIYEGPTGGRGFDDLLVDSGDPALAEAMRSAVVRAITAIEAVGADVPTALAANPDALIPVYDAIKSLTDLLKTQFITVLDLEVPMRAETDND